MDCFGGPQIYCGLHLVTVDTARWCKDTQGLTQVYYKVLLNVHTEAHLPTESLNSLVLFFFFFFFKPGGVLMILHLKDKNLAQHLPLDADADPCTLAE